MTQISNKFNSNIMELASIERLGVFVDEKYKYLNYNHKNDEFDFTNDDRTWAVEQTSYFDKSELEYMIYENERNSGKNPSLDRVKGALADCNGEILAFIGTGMTETKTAILRAINKKNERCLKRLVKESSFKKVDLVVTVPDNPLFNDKNSMKPLDEYIKKGNFVFNEIIILFYNSIYIFDAKTGNFKFIPYSYKIE